MSASPREHRLEDATELRRVVLAVAVDAHGDVVAVLEREPEARLHGAADAEVERQAQHVRALRRGDVRRAIGRAVVDDDDVEVRRRTRAARRSRAAPCAPRSAPARSRGAGAPRGSGERRRRGRRCDRLRHRRPPGRRGRAARAAAARDARTCARRAPARARASQLLAPAPGSASSSR